MADIFISYTRDDAARVGELAAELEQRGFSVFWDTEVLPGQLWRDVIHDELVRASCVIVVWSHGSTRSRWVVEEASEALEAGKLLPVLFDGSLPPFGFRAVEAAILSEWTPGAPSQEFDNLVDAVRRVVADTPTDDDAADPLPAQPSDDDAPRPEPLPITPAGEGHDAETEEVTVVDASPSQDDTASPLSQEPAPLAPSQEPVLPTSLEEPVPTEPDEAPDSIPTRPDQEQPLSQEEPTQPPEIDDADRTLPPELDASGSDFRPPSAGGDRRPGGNGAVERTEGLVARLGTGGIVGIGAAAVLVVVLGIVIAAQGGDGDPPASTLADGRVSTVVSDVAETEIVESDAVTAFPAATAPVIDGDLSEWEGVPEAYRLRTEVFRDPDVVDRLGDDSPGIVTAVYDDTALYLAVVSDDDIYSQANTGNQIWRGDALDINLSTASPGGISERPDRDDFQLTMTPQAADGQPSIVWFTGNGSGFADNRTDLPVAVSGAIDDDGSWQLEAAIPWSVFGLQGPPTDDLAALLAVFDNDGELVDGVPQQTVILGNTSAEFQGPLTWGTLTLER